MSRELAAQHADEMDAPHPAAAEQASGGRSEVAGRVKRLGPGDHTALAELLAAYPAIARWILSLAAPQMGNAAVQRAIAVSREPGGAGTAAGAHDEQNAVSSHAFTGAGHGRVTVSGLNVRQSADASSHANVIGGLHHGDAVEAVGREGAWIRIKFRGQDAFVHGAYVEITPAAPAAALKVEPPAGSHGPATAAAPVVPAPQAVEAVKQHVPVHPSAEHAAPAANAPAHPAVAAAPAHATVAPAVTAAPAAHAPAPAPTAAPEAHAPAPTPTPAVHAPAPAPTPVVHAPAPAPTPVVHAPAPAPTAAPAAHAPAVAPAAHAPAPAPTAAAHAPAPAPAASPAPDHHAQLQAEVEAIVRDFDAGHLDQGAAIRRFVAFDTQHSRALTPDGAMLMGPLMTTLATHEVARLRARTEAHAPVVAAPAHDAAGPANAPHAAPAGKEQTAGVQLWTPPAVARLGDPQLEALAANLHDPKVVQLMQDLAGVVTLHDALYKHRTAKEVTGPDRENLVAGIAVVHAELAALDGAAVGGGMAAFKVAVNHKLEEASPYHSQVNIRTIETGAYTTCNVTSLAMALEATGRNADSYKASKLPTLLAVAQMYSSDVAKATMTSHGNATSFESLRGLRLPDFMEFAAIAYHLHSATPTPEEIKAAAIKAAGDKTHIDVLAGIAGDFGASATAEYMSFGGAAGNKALEKYADAHHGQADAIADARNAGDQAKYQQLSAATPLEGGPIEDQVSLAAYKAKVMATIKPQIDAGAGIISGTYNHFTRCFAVTDDHVMVQDPGQFKRSERRLLWPEARALRYFWNYVVIK